MKRFNIQIAGILIMASTLMGSCHSQSFDESIPDSDIAQDVSSYDPGAAIIKLSADPDHSSLRSIESTLTGSLRGLSDDRVKLEHVFYIGGPYEKAQREAGLHLWMKATFDKKADLSEVFDRLRKNPLVAHVEGISHATPEPATYRPVSTGELRALNSGDYNAGYPTFKNPDPYLTKQWHYQNEGSATDERFQAGADINLFSAWKRETGKKNVIVAVVDMGIYADHEDLKDNMWHNTQDAEANGSCGYNAIYDNYTVEAGYHGTHVAGTIAARNNNGIGVAGIAGGDGSTDSGVRLMSCQIFGKDQVDDAHSPAASYDQIARGFEWITEHGAVIANCSWGNSKEETADSFSPVLKAAIDYFIKNAGTDGTGKQKDDSPMKGGVVIFAAGNSSWYKVNVAPGFYDKVISVASFTPDFKRAEYSNCGDWVDLSAPGGLTPLSPNNAQGILSTISPFFPQISIGKDIKGAQFLYPNNSNYAFAQGTSMATPHVTGIAALIASKYGKQGFTNEDLKERLLSAIKPISPDAYNESKYVGLLGKGYVDAGMALEDNEKKAPKMVKAVETEVDFYSVMLSWTNYSDEDAASAVAYKYELTLNGGDKTYTYSVPNIKGEGAKLSHTFTDLKDGTKYDYTLTAIDRWGNKSKPETGSITTTTNSPPEVDLPDVVLLSRDKIQEDMHFAVTDKEGHDWTLKPKNVPSNISLSKKDGQLYCHFVITEDPGDYSLSFILSDIKGKSQEYTLKYKVIKKYEAPRKKADFGEIKGKSGSTSSNIDLSDKFDSSTGLPLTFTVESTDPSIVRASIVDGHFLKLEYLKEGTTEVTITVDDGKAKSTFPLKVNSLSAINGGSKNTSGMYILYPIPTVDVLNIQTQSSGTLKVTITSLRGEVVLVETASIDQSTHIATINVKSITPGIYDVHLNSGSDDVVRRILKN